MADFLPIPPREPDPTFENGLAQLRAQSDAELRRDLRATTRAELAPGLEAAGLGELVGGNRATILDLLDVPRSTSQLVALTGLTLGSVGTHLRVLLGAGVVLRRRAGREVLYWRTRLGDALIASGTPTPTGRRDHRARVRPRRTP